MDLDSKALEAAAEALWQADSERAAGRRRLTTWTDESEATRDQWRFMARAAITAYEAAKPSGWVSVPVEPSDALLQSMAIRYDHGLGLPGYYDQPIFGAENVGHARRLEATITTMRQLHEEVVGTGFYRPSPPTESA